MISTDLVMPILVHWTIPKLIFLGSLYVHFAWLICFVFRVLSVFFRVPLDTHISSASRGPPIDRVIGA